MLTQSSRQCWNTDQSNVDTTLRAMWEHQPKKRSKKRTVLMKCILNDVQVSFQKRNHQQKKKVAPAPKKRYHQQKKKAPPTPHGAPRGEAHAQRALGHE